MSSEKRGPPESHASSSSDKCTDLRSQSKKQKINESDFVGNDLEDVTSSEALELADNGFEYSDEDYDYGDDFYDYDDVNDDEDYHFLWRFGVKTPEMKLEEIENMLTVWKNAKMKIMETMDESEKLLEDIRSILVETRNVGKAFIETLQEKSCEQDEVFIEIQEMKDKIASQIKSVHPQQDNLKLQSLQFKSFILQAQTEVLTKVAFAEIKRGNELTKKSEGHEKRILELITTQKERLDYYEEMIGRTETDKEGVMKQMSDEDGGDENAVEVSSCSELVV